MIYNLGSQVTLTWSPGSSLGAATLAVTDPNAVTTTVGPVQPSGGVYTATYTPSVAGRHTLSWTATTPPTVYDDTFEVRASPLSGLISLADARDHLRLRSADTADDAKIQSMIEAATAAIVDITGPITPTTFTEWFNGGVSTYVVENRPVLSVQTVLEYYGTSAYTLTEQPLGHQTTAYAFTMDYTTGELMRRTWGGAPALFALGNKNITISYTAGRTTVPEQVQLATKELVRHLYQSTQVPNRPKRGAADEGYGEVPIGFAVPNFVVELLQSVRRPPGVA